MSKYSDVWEAFKQIIYLSRILGVDRKVSQWVTDNVLVILSAMGGKTEHNTTFEDLKMSGKKPDYVDIPLVQSDKEKIIQLNPVVEVLEGLTLATLEGYRVYVKADSANVGIEVVMYGADKTPNSGKALTARGHNWDFALRSLYYKHCVLAKGGAWVTTPTNEIEWLG